MGAKRLAETCEIVMGQSPPGVSCNTEGIGIPLLNGPTEFGAHHPFPVQFTTDARKLTKPGDLLFCVRGSTTGRMNWADREYSIGRGVAAIRHKVRADLQPLIRAVIEYSLPELLSQATGSTFPNVSADQLSKVSWPSISEAEQRAIAHILGTLDDKIELNRRMSETLEGMARALFKSWFVDFDPVRAKAAGRDPALPKEIAALFPSRLVKSELGEIPEGWAVKPFLETVDVIGGGTPKTSEPEYWDGEIPWFSVVDAPSYSDIWVVNTEKKITQKGVEASSTKVLPVGTTIISARGTVGKVALVGTPMAMNQSCYGLRGKQDVKGIFNYFSTRALIGILQQHAHGSVFDTITRDTLAKVPVALPMELLVNKFESLVGPLVDRVLRNVHESRTLAALRDALLPKIISGELRVRNEEKVAARRSA